ncbi:MAG: PAS domain S-box protein [Opitutae bacterium]|nr:PAS domain S-box protein [Opitutae bacterium]
MIGWLAQFWQGSLRRQLIIAMAGVHALLMSVFVWNHTERERALLLTLQADQARAMAQALATSSAGWLAARDVAGLQEIVEAQRRYPELVFVMMLDRQGGILAHTDRSRLGQYVRDLPEDARYTVLSRTPELVDAAEPSLLGGQPVGWVRVGLGQRVARSQLGKIARDGLVYALAASGIGALIAGLLGTRLTAKLYAVRRVSEAVRHGRRGERVPDLGRDEAGQFGRDFNEMLDVLSERESQLQRESTERKRSEDAVRLQGAALEVAANAIVITTRAGVIIWVNPAFTALTGYTLAETMGKTPGQIIGSGRHSPQFFKEMWAVLLADRVWHGEIVNRRKDGELYTEEMMITPLKSDGREISHFIAIKQDITARKAAEVALRESEERFRQVVETINEVFWLTDAASGKLLYISPGCDKVWGRSSAEFYLDDTLWDKAIHPDDLAKVRAARETQALSGYNLAYRISRPDGAERWVRCQTWPVRTDGGQAARIVGVAQDITEQKTLEQQFLRAQRMEAIGALASGMAHDLNNILSPMLMAAGILRDKLPTPHDRSILDMVAQNAQRGADIIRQLLTFSRGAGGARIGVQPTHLLKEMVRVMEETFPRNIEIEHSEPRDTWVVLADPTQLQQVIMNLCVNARDALPEGGKLTLTARNTELTAADAGLDPAAKPGRYVVLTVADTGSGIPPEIRHKIFDPFFTTKPIGKGTGLGLATVAGIVKGHDGFVTVESEVGKGTAFMVYLPAQPTAPPAPSTAPAITGPSGHGELILVVDDEKSICETLRHALELSNYRVLTAGNGADALRAYDAHPGEVRLVFTDIMMPVMGGVELITALRERDPKVRIIAASGLVKVEKLEELSAQGVDVIMTKPFDFGKLLETIHQVLARKDNLHLRETPGPRI